MLSRHRLFVAAFTIAIAPVGLMAQAAGASAPPGTRLVTAVPELTSPRYPDSLRTARVPGNALAQFVVDTNGVVDPSTVKIVSATNPLFADAVQNALPNMRFLPAIVNGRKIRQLVQQPIIFNIMGTEMTAEEREARSLYHSHENGTPDGSGTQTMMLGLIIIRGNPGSY